MEQEAEWGKSRRWDATKLGPVESWPQKLKSMISGVLKSANPAWICLSKDRMTIHNDSALRAISNPVNHGSNHHCPLWPSSLEVVEMVFSQGKPFWHEYEPITTAPAYCLTPLYNEDGETDAVVCVFSADMPGATTDIITAEPHEEKNAESVQLSAVIDDLLHFETIFELSRDGIMVFDVHLRMVKWNPAMEEMTGIKSSDAIGKTLYELDPEAHQSAETALVGIASCSRDFRYNIPSSGRRGYCDGVFIPLFHDGDVVGAIGFVRETTCRKKQKEALIDSELRFSNLAAHIPISGMIANEAGEIQHLNLAAANQFGYKAEELLGAPVSKVLSGFNVTPNHSYPQSPVELMGKKKNGEEVPLEVSIATWAAPSGTTIGFLARDLTTWKKAEQVLAQARDSALQAVEMKSHFVANMSHELRTPLVAVIGAADLMKTTGLNAEQEDLLESITISSNTLLHLVNDLLDFSKMELGVMAVENSPFDLPAAVMEIKNKFHPEATKKQLQLNTVIDSSLPNIVGGDGQKIRQILHNLVSNAIKFTHQGEVTVQTTLMEDDSSTVMIRFAVKDTGVGISKEMLPLLFSVFTQGDTSLTRKFGGTGIGLAMCKHLVKLMGGDIGVTSNVGTGSEFWAALPFRKISAVVKTEHSAEIISSTTPTTSLSKHQHTLLLVEDNPMNQKIIKACLAKIGIRSLHVVDNGAEAVQTVTQQQYDLILMDCQMPIMDGYVATVEIRRHETTNSITRTPIIALTAHGLPQDREKCIHAGMDDYICKPLKLNELKSILAKYLPL